MEMWREVHHEGGRRNKGDGLGGLENYFLKMEGLYHFWIQNKKQKQKQKKNKKKQKKDKRYLFSK
jgi:hypothetical protein